jgi:phosphoribosylanthranilate isomerase
MRLFHAQRVGVKICGITSESDAHMCISEGANALGFNFFQGSKRYLNPKNLDWIRTLNGKVDRVAVVVNASADLLATLRKADCFELIQFHGDESPKECEGSGFNNWIKAIRVKNEDVLKEAMTFSCSSLLLDAWSVAGYGGTGEVADWQMIRNFADKSPDRNIILAGGLKSENVASAIRCVRPKAVDVAGGVESAPGIKCQNLVRSFIQESNKVLF